MIRRLVLALSLLSAPALAQEAPGLGFPQFAGEANIGFYTEALRSGADRSQRGSRSYIFGEVAAGLHLHEQVSIQGLLHVEPIGSAPLNGNNLFFRDQAAYLESLYLNWRVTDRLTLFAGKFSAPFGYGHHYFPGVLAMLRAHEAYLIRESMGFGATWTFLSDARWGEHDLTAAVFAQDTSFLSNTLLTRRRCCEDGYERYRRTTLAQGGPGNNGRLQNAAIALDGDNIGWLPNFTYHLAVLSRGAGKDGTAREWGYAAGARYEARWNDRLRTLFFGEYVEFRNAGGRPVETDALGDSMAVAERRRFSTLGARTSWGAWRATLVWQRDERKRSVNALPTENYVEATIGRDLLFGFGIDIGYQYSRYARDDGSLGQSNALVSRIGFRSAF